MEDEKKEDAKLDVLSDLLDQVTQMVLEMKGGQESEKEGMKDEESKEGEMTDSDSMSKDGEGVDAGVPGAAGKLEVKMEAKPLDGAEPEMEDGGTDPLLSFMEAAGKPKGSEKVGSMMKAPGNLPMPDKKKLSSRL